MSGYDGTMMWINTARTVATCLVALVIANGEGEPKLDCKRYQLDRSTARG